MTTFAIGSRVIIMSSILYLPAENGVEERFSELIGMANRKKKIKVYRSLADLSAILHRPRSNVKVAVLFAANQEELTGILSLENLMGDVKVILILKDAEKDTIVKAHMLRPRYITWLDSDLSDIVTVFNRMIDLYDVPIRRKGISCQGSGIGGQ
jgi:hypothetical protein